MRFAACFVALSVLVVPARAQRDDAAFALPARSAPLAADGSLVWAPSAVALPEHDARPPAVPAIPVPEPGTLFLVGTGLVGFALTARYRRRSGK